MNMHEKLRWRLVEIVGSALPQMSVEKGILLRWNFGTLDVLEAGDNALDGKLRQELSQYISDTPFSDFVLGYLNDALERSSKYEDVAPHALIGKKGFEDPQLLATSVVDAFSSLPWDYTFVYPLPLNAESAPDREYPLGAGWSLVCPGPVFRRN